MAREATAAGTAREIEEAHGSGAVPRRPVVLVRGEGTRLWDEDGREYIDVASAQGWASLGHGHPDVTAAIVAQAGRLVAQTESAFNDERARWFADLAAVFEEHLGTTDLGPVSRIQPCSSGAEAIEAAIKIARLSTRRPGIVAVRRAFHGRTLGALTATANPKYREPFAPLVPGFAHVAPDDEAGADAAVGDDTAAVLVEIVQGEGGVHPLDEGFLRALRRLCDERGALLVVDEIQTGLGRTGAWFACEHAGIRPDVITLGKSIGGGIPMGVAAWRERIGTFPPGTHGSTFGGNPLACAASRAVIAVLERDELPERAARLGELAFDELRAIDAPVVREVRGRGLMIGVELRTRVAPVIQGLMDRGVWALPAGLNVLRLLPPLTIEESDLRAALAAVGEVLRAS